MLAIMRNIKTDFNNISALIEQKNPSYLSSKKEYTCIEIYNHINGIQNTYIPQLQKKQLRKLKELFCKGKRDTIVANICYINGIIKKHDIKYTKLCHSGKKNNYMRDNIKQFLQQTQNNKLIFGEMQKRFPAEFQLGMEKHLNSYINTINVKWNNINNNMTRINTTLNNAVYGHTTAKRQLKRIIGQWINGKQTGYCFGFEGPPGVGKCHEKGTPVMLSNGKIKKVENIKVGDKIMGDDSTPRNILALGRGREKMYEIKPVKGDSYIVNESHILSLKMTKKGKKGTKHQLINGERYWKNDIVDICIKDYLSLPKSQKECLKGYRVGVEFPEKKVELDPYILGYWLGDGTSSKPEITTEDNPVVEYFRYYCEELDLLLKEVGNSKITYRMTSGIKGGIMTDRNPMLNMLRKYKVLNNKHIPHVYKCNSRAIQLELLAGLIDSDGSLHKNGGYDIIQKNEALLDDIIFLARSLGFTAHKTECKKSCMYKGEKREGTYYRTFIHGEGVEYIPVKLERKKTNKRKQIKNALNTGIKVIPLEEDEYYGFQIDGNSRFLLGDFTVTHNTSLAKNGLSQCLLNETDNTHRPFAFIPVGGSCNGSTLSGHNYTYVGSTWGRIVDILIDKKCMNPIIFIDELDKVSKSEHGKEIIGILTHLVDSTQNDSFQDKYFDGIDLDLSKALFIFSYNDPDAIDRILLDRIHRIKFDHLSLDDKLVIANNYLLPEIYKNVGLTNIVKLSDEIIIYIIEHYTYEAGVRKLKEILFEIISEINLSILQNTDAFTTIPIEVTKEDIKHYYLKERTEVRQAVIHDTPQIGVISGLWANALGKGGIIPIECSQFPAQNFMDLRLTGLQGEVMKK